MGGRRGGKKRRENVIHMCQGSGSKTRGAESVIISINFENSKDAVWPIII